MSENTKLDLAEVREEPRGRILKLAADGHALPHLEGGTVVYTKPARNRGGKAARLPLWRSLPAAVLAAQDAGTGALQFSRVKSKNACYRQVFIFCQLLWGA